MSALETMSAEDNAAMEQMRAADTASAATEAPSAPEPKIEIVTEAPAAPEATTEAAQEDSRPKTVPHQAFHEERERRKKIEADFAKFREEQAASQARVEERLRLLGQAAQMQQAPAQQQEPSLPDFNADPAAHISARFAQLERQLQQVGGLTVQQQQAAMQAHQEQMVRLAAQTQEQAFAAQQADYQAAANHLRGVRDAELRALGMLDPMQRAQVIQNDVMELARRAHAEGANFPQRVYELAKIRGYAPAQTVTAQVPAAPAIEAPAAPDRMATQQRGREMAATIGTVGSAPATRLTPERIASMSDSEFNAIYDKLAKDPVALRQLFGE